MFFGKSILVALMGGVAVGGSVAVADSYSVDIARAQVSLACTIKGGDKGTEKCAITMDSQAKIAVNLEQTKEGDYVGVDVADHNGAWYALAVQADKNKALHSVSLIREQMSDDKTSVVANVAASETSTLAAVHISPIFVQVVDENTLQFALTVFAYGPSSTNTIANVQDGRKALVDYVKAKIRPALQIARSKKLR